jgi:dolichyl-phosphate beta-glucosyltransferase
MKLTVVVPAYNEEARIGKTLQAINAFLSEKSFDYEIVVVDDGSKDATQKVVGGLGIKAVRIVSYGRNRGKGYAINFGANCAKGEWILMTDADNSTPITELDKLWPFTDDYEVIIGSRYRRGSHIAVRQGVPRILLSRLGNILVQLLLLPGIRDSQCGFKLFSSRAAKKIFPLQTVWGWGFDMELLRIAKERGYKIKEVPVTWYNDEQSRIQNARVFTKTFAELLTIKRNSMQGEYLGRPSELGTMVRFATVGAVGTILDYSVLNFTHLALGFNLYWALTLGFATGAINNYVLNSIWSFRQRLSWVKLGQFLAVALIGLGLNNGIVYLLTEFGDWHYNLSKLVALAIVFFWNYGANRLWTFQQH